MLDSFISRSEFCKKLNIHPASARRWELNGKLTPVTVTDGCVRYSVREVARLIEDAQVNPKRRPGPKPKASQRPSSAYPAPTQDHQSPAKAYQEALRNLAFAQGRTVIMYRTLAEVKLLELEKARGQTEALSAFLQAVPDALAALIQEDATTEAVRLLTELEKVALSDGTPLASEPSAVQLFSKLRAGLPSIENQAGEIAKA